MRSSADITPAIAASIKGMLRRGDKQHWIASWWDLPVVHVSRIATGKRDRAVAPAPPETLPPPGPYQIVSVDAHARLQEAAAVPTKTLQEVLSRLGEITRQLDRLEARLDTRGQVQAVDGGGSRFAISHGQITAFALPREGC